MSRNERQAGELPEQHQQDQVVGQHHAQHGAHEEQQEGEEARRRVGRVEVPGGVQHHQRADAGDEQREQPGQAVHAQAEVEPQRRQPGHAEAQHLAAEDRRRRREHQRQCRQRRGAGEPGRRAPRRRRHAGHERRRPARAGRPAAAARSCAGAVGGSASPPASPGSAAARSSSSPSNRCRQRAVVLRGQDQPGHVGRVVGRGTARLPSARSRAR